MLVIDIDPIRQKQILLHPSSQLASFTSDIDSALKDALLFQDSIINRNAVTISILFILHLLFNYWPSKAPQN